MGSITVSNLGKAYKQYPTRWSRLAEWVLPGNKSRHILHWVLKDISFTVHPGEAMGIVGINGAGKSTLLKIITGTTQPTAGSVHITGRVAALLELGMGFHPDFTGRQNVYMAGQLLGYSPEEMARLLPEIEAFAEIGEYLDQQVRVYSSGMQMRLAFSVATARRPDVLIVDEALSVGDAYFQHKSFARIRQFREGGTTLLLVSHDRSAVLSVCDQAILLKAGQIVYRGKPEAVMDYYNAMLTYNTEVKIKQECCDEERTKTESGSFEAKIVEVSLNDSCGKILDLVCVGQEVQVVVVVKVQVDINGLVLGCGIKDRLGNMVFGTNTFHTNQRINSASAGEVFVFRVSFVANLGVGSYSVHCSIVPNETHIDRNYHWIDNALIFSVVNTDRPIFVGCSWNEMKFQIDRLRHEDIREKVIEKN